MAMPFRRDGSYLLTGGLGGVGLVVAEWMARKGAGHLVLCNRRGNADSRVQASLQLIEDAGASVEIVPLDVTDESAVKATLERIRRDGPPLRGIIHMAMVLSDGLIPQQSRDSLTRVLGPKISGAWHLHQQTLEDDLDLFVMFSSFAAVIGNPGQANYSAANMFLHALAAYRRARGLPGLAIEWGPIGGMGYVARHENISRHFERSGLTAFEPQELERAEERLFALRALLADYHRQLDLTVMKSPIAGRVTTPLIRKSIHDPWQAATWDGIGNEVPVRFGCLFRGCPTPRKRESKTLGRDIDARPSLSMSHPGCRVCTGSATAATSRCPRRRTPFFDPRPEDL
jgi:NAD(P)-dependent dehydrogenase (short-subunit alcohol dehydrogenase family)